MCKKSKENAESINPRVLKISNDKTMVISECAICGSKESKNKKQVEY